MPGATLFSTETLRASRTFRAEATASFRRPSRPAEGKAPVAEMGRGIAAAGAWGLGRAGATGMGLTAANDPVGLAGAGRAGAGVGAAGFAAGAAGGTAARPSCWMSSRIRAASCWMLPIAAARLLSSR